MYEYKDSHFLSSVVSPVRVRHQDLKKVSCNCPTHVPDHICRSVRMQVVCLVQVAFG